MARPRSSHQRENVIWFNALVTTMASVVIHIICGANDALGENKKVHTRTTGVIRVAHNKTKPQIDGFILEYSIKKCAKRVSCVYEYVCRAALKGVENDLTFALFDGLV